MDNNGDVSVAASVSINGGASSSQDETMREVSTSTVAMVTGSGGKPSPSPSTFAQNSVTSSFDQTVTTVSNNAPGFKYKYPEAAPTPPGEDDTYWNKIYTAADSRMYNKHGKDANNSRKYRQSGETRALALIMLEEKKAKEAAGILPRAKPKPVVTKISSTNSPSGSRNATPSLEIGMSISEQIKSGGGRARKESSVGPTSSGSTPVPTPAPTLKQIVKKGIAMTKKPPTKKQKINHNPSGTPNSSGRASQTPGSAPDPLSADDSDASAGSGTLYCTCQKPDDHSLMIECAKCQDWFHPRCMGISDRDVRDWLVDRFVCPRCTEPDFTTNFKRICRLYNVNEGCRKPARVNDNPPNKPSKYCSEECREAFWKHIASLLRKGDEPSIGGALNRSEVANLLAACPTIEAFYSLGSKPKLQAKTEPDRPLGLQFLTEDEDRYIKLIEAQKKFYEAQIVHSQNQVKLLNMVHERAKRAAQHLGKDNKSPICGYDGRLGFNPEQFIAWFASEEAQTAYSTGVLGPRSSTTKLVNSRIPTGHRVTKTNGTVAGEDSDITRDICLNPIRKCKHLGWREMHNQEFTEGQASHRAKIAKLERDLIECIEAAETREATRDYFSNNQAHFKDDSLGPLPGR